MYKIKSKDKSIKSQTRATTTLLDFFKRAIIMIMLNVYSWISLFLILDSRVLGSYRSCNGWEHVGGSTPR